jgi:large subunit ribosomal protein L10
VDRATKEQQVAALNGTFQEASLVVVAHYSGLTVSEITDLRRQMREVGASFKVTKNRLTRLALEGTKYEPLTDMFTGPTGIAFSSDPVAAAKVSVEFAKKNDKLIVLGGAMGDTVLDASGVKALASMPSLDELRGKIVGLLQAPATKVAGVLQAPAGQMARVMGAYAAKGEAA